MSNKLYCGSEARSTLKEGVDFVYKAAAPTLGANGRNGAYNKYTRVPIITNDGVSIARECEPEDLGALQGANLLKQVSERTNDEAGDGTTTSIVLAHAIISKGMELMEKNPKVNPMKLRREITAATEKVLAELKQSAQTVTTLEELEHVATISVEDAAIGKTIAKAIYDAGDTGVVYVNDSEEIGVSIEKIEGYQFAQGMITPYLIKDVDRMETVLLNPVVLVTDVQLHYTNELQKMVDALIQQGVKNMLIVCDEFHPDVLKWAVVNSAKNIFNIAMVKKPMAAAALEDIATVVGAEAMTENKGMVYPKIEYLGTCEKVVVSDKKTIIFQKPTERLTTYVDALKKQLELAEDEPTEVKLKERIAALTGGLYLLNVGDKTEAEAKYLRLKVDDAVNATKAAREEGIVAGGGSVLYTIGLELLGKTSISGTSDKTYGEIIVYESCLEPLSRIVQNSGEDMTEIAPKIFDALATGSCPGYDALAMEVVPDVIARGIIDPIKVTRNALSNAASFAGLFLTIETLLTPIPQAEHGLVK